MARKKQKAAFRKALQLPLFPEDEPHITEAINRGYDDVITDLFAVIAEGYRMSVSYDVEFETFSAQLYGERPGTPNAGVAIYGNAATPFAAMVVLWYKACVKYVEHPWEGFEPEDRAQRYR